MVLIIWFIDELTNQYVNVGQANITLNQFHCTKSINDRIIHSLQISKLPITLANKVVGQADFEMKYRVTDSV